MKWRNAQCIELVVQKMPGNFAELESLLVALNDGLRIFLWLTKNLLIAMDIIPKNVVCKDNKARFPKAIYKIDIASPRDTKTIVVVHSCSESDAFTFLKQAGRF